MKSFFIYSLWCFWPFSLAVQFHTLFLVFITIFHKNTPNTGCPVLGVHIRKTNKSALHFINEVAGKSRLYIIFLLLVQMVLGISSVFYAMLLRGLIDGAVAHDSKKMLTFCVLFVVLVVGQIALRAVLRFLEEYAKATYENAFKSRLFAGLLTHNYGAVTATHSGEWMNHLTSDTVVVSEGLATIVPGVAGMVTKEHLW